VNFAEAVRKKGQDMEAKQPGPSGSSANWMHDLQTQQVASHLIQTPGLSSPLPPAVYESLTRLSNFYQHIEQATYRLGYLKSEIETLKELAKNFEATEAQICQAEALAKENAELRRSLPKLQNDASRAKSLQTENEELQKELISLEESQASAWAKFCQWFGETFVSVGVDKEEKQGNSYYQMIRNSLKVESPEDKVDKR
jgi:DNA repair exonuclease SbcCD ATPase subunit